MSLSTVGRCLLGLLLTTSSTVYANDLLDIYRLAQTQDQTLKAAIYQRNASIEAHPQAVAALLPQLSGSLEHDQDRNHALTGTQQLTTSVSADTSTDPTYYHSDSYSLNLSQTIFNWAAFKTVAQASAQAAQAQASYLAAEQSLIYRVADAYFSVLNAEDSLRSDRAAQAAYKRQLTQAQRKFQAGLTTIIDTRNAQSSYSNSIAAIISDRRLLESARRQLGELIGQPIASIAPLKDEIPLIEPTPSTPDEWVNTALQDNPNLMNYLHATTAARKGIDIIRSQHLPTVNLVGSITRTDQDPNANPSDSITDSIGVQVNWAILQGGLLRSKTRQAEATFSQTQAQYEGYRRTVDHATRDAFDGVISGIASVEANRAALLANQTNLEATQGGLKVGTRTQVDVLNAQQSLTAAERAYYQSRYDYLRNVLSLKQQAGQLTESDITNIDLLLLTLETAPEQSVPN